MISTICNEVFDRCIRDYHLTDDVDAVINNPYPAPFIEHLLYAKCWVDAVQWHLEDIVRNPTIDPVAGLALKRRIDASNQVRTDMVEYIDSYFLEQYETIQRLPTATLNTESPAWAVDRLSILALKVYHMAAEAERQDAGEEHRKTCAAKLAVLNEQRKDLSTAIDQLISDIVAGRKYMKVYKQMKMYNDPGLNPVLYQQKST
jgi:hypothetical protein